MTIHADKYPEQSNTFSHLLSAIAGMLSGRSAAHSGARPLSDLLSAVNPALGPAVHNIAGYLRGHEVRHALHQTQDFARRRPGLFVLGAFVAGFATARFFRSARDERDAYRSAGYGI